MNETTYCTRRLPRPLYPGGPLIVGDFDWLVCDGPEDWSRVEEQLRPGDGAAEFEMARLTIEPIARRKFSA